MDYLVPALLFALMGLVFALLLAIASRAFAVKQDPRIAELTDCLPGANCGGCGYTGCAAYAEAVAKGEAEVGACNPGGTVTANAMGKIMGVEVSEVVRLRAQVMCSGVLGAAKIKYHYAGAPDCTSAARLGGGDKLCPNGCIGLGSCVTVCPTNAISVKNGVAWVDPSLCSACGICMRLHILSAALRPIRAHKRALTVRSGVSDVRSVSAHARLAPSALTAHLPLSITPNARAAALAFLSARARSFTA